MEPVPNTIAQHTAEMKAAAVAEKVQADATKKVADLEKELAAIEQSYYEENDPAYRDDVIKKKFEQKKTELETARAALNK
jgi:NAD-dependent DNA ligase